jgi:hypothetical protein
LVLVKLFTAGKTRKKFYQTGNSAFAGDLRPCAIALKQYFPFLCLLSCGRDENTEKNAAGACYLLIWPYSW